MSTIPAVDRDFLLDGIADAMGTLFDAGIDLEMGGLCVGGVLFLITGEEGTRLTDSDIFQWAANPEALAAMLYTDLEASWRGFNAREKDAARLIADTISRAVAVGVGGHDDR